MGQHERRYRVCYISPSDVIAILNGDLTIDAFDVPSDARVINVFDDMLRMAFGITIESASFEPVGLGCIPPQLSPPVVRPKGCTCLQFDNGVTVFLKHDSACPVHGQVDDD